MNVQPWGENTRRATTYPPQDMGSQNLPNRFIYVKQSFFQLPSPIPPPPPPIQLPSKVLINPHFRKTVYVNPQFNPQKKIHVNPKILQHLALPLTKKPTPVPAKPEQKIEEKTTVISTKNKLIRIPCNTSGINVQSKFDRKKRISLHSKYKIVRSSTNGSTTNCSFIKKNSNGVINKFKLDKRTQKTNTSINNKSNKKKYVYINRFLSISVMAKNVLLKGNTNLKRSNYVNINGILYKKSPNSLKRELNISKNKTLKSPVSSKYKIVRKSNEKTESTSTRKSLIKRYKLIRSKKANVKVVPSKLRKCNLPCPIYRKFGRCKGKDNGSCFKLHNPDQIVLCTRFLQGACHNDKCLLSHKVSLEKMPTCKFYLEGLCSKDNCPYLHVKISPKAEICRDFLAGFCKEGAKCEKRHQFLCPDYEKSKNCLKKRCPYPHGNLVRTRKVTNIVAKKCFYKKEKPKKLITNYKRQIKSIENENSDKPNTNRYYDPEKDRTDKDKICCIETVSKSRPKLGQLPAFIPLFEEIT